MMAARARQAFLLESAENEKNLGRYSFIGIDPLLMFESFLRTLADAPALVRGEAA